MSDIFVNDPSVVVIFSIWPLKSAKEERPNYQPVNSFEMPAGSPEDIQRFVVKPCYELGFGLTGTERPKRFISAQELADDLLKCWVNARAYTGMPVGAQPGIWINAEQNNLTDKQIKSSLIFKEMVEKQDAFARGYVDEADRAHAEKTPMSAANIGKVHRSMAEYLKITGREWQHVDGHEKMKTCPWCQRHIDTMAIICLHCHQIADPVLYKNKQAEHAAMGVVAASVEKVTGKPAAGLGL